MDSNMKAQSWRWTRAHAIPVVWEGEGNYVVMPVDGQLGWAKTGDGAALGAMFIREQDLLPLDEGHELIPDMPLLPVPEDYDAAIAAEERAELNQGLSPDDPRYLDAQFTVKDREDFDEWAAEEGLRRAELGQEEWGGPEDPRERDADYAYMDLMASMPTAPATAETVLAGWDTEDAALQHGFNLRLEEKAALATGAEAKLRAAGVELGALVSQVFANHRAENESYEEVYLFNAPSECCGLIAASSALARAAILARVGLTVAEYHALIDMRGSAKQNYALGLYIQEGD